MFAVTHKRIQNRVKAVKKIHLLRINSREILIFRTFFYFQTFHFNPYTRPFSTWKIRNLWKILKEEYLSFKRKKKLFVIATRERWLNFKSEKRLSINISKRNYPLSRKPTVSTLFPYVSDVQSRISIPEDDTSEDTSPPIKRRDTKIAREERLW